MHWIIQENICQEKQWNELISSLERYQIPHSIHKVVPFEGSLIPEPILNTNKIWAMGSTAMANICKKNGWYPGVIELPDFDEQKRNWGAKLLNYDSQEYTMIQLLDEILTEQLYFIKPNNDSKFIAGQVMSNDEIKDWAHRVVNLGENDGSNVNMHSKVILASPKNIQVEARFWIIDHKVITYSLYKMGNTVIYSRDLVDQDLIYYASLISTRMPPERWQPARAYCLDLCRDINDEIKIVEINNMNSSGLYDWNITKLIGGIQEAFC
mgnify:CR=1 FL=1